MMDAPAKERFSCGAKPASGRVRGKSRRHGRQLVQQRVRSMRSIALQKAATGKQRSG